MRASQAEFFKQRFVEKNAHDIMDAYDKSERASHGHVHAER